MTEKITQYESLRDHSIGTVVSQSENEVILDFDGTQKTIKVSNLKRWYKPCGIIEEEALSQEKKQAKKLAKLEARVNDPNKPNGDAPPKEDCEKLAQKIISYLEKKGCVTKKTCSYTRVRLENSKRNIMEVWWGKRLTGLKVVVRHEAVKSNEKLFAMGRTVPPTHFYVLDQIYKFNNSTDINDIYAIMDLAVEYEKNYKPKTEPNRKKNGTGRINGKQSLKSKRESLGIKDDNERLAEMQQASTEKEQLAGVK